MSSVDLLSLAAECGSVPVQVGAVLMLAAPDSGDPSPVLEALAQRITAIPRLRQRLMNAPWGCGRPVWVDDEAFTFAQHVSVFSCPTPGDESAVLQVAADLLVTRLPRDRPLWAATLVTNAGDGCWALIFIFHHVLADGIGGLAVLAGLVDGGEITAAAGFPIPMPSRRRLAADATVGRLQSVRKMPAALRRLRVAFRQLGSGLGRPEVLSSLNRPTGPRRYLATVGADLEEVHRSAHAHQATVNDLVLSAIAAALHRILAGRGEQVDGFAIAVPVSPRRTTTAGDLGNVSAIVPVRVSGVGDPLLRLTSLAELTHKAKQDLPGASAALLGPVFRVLARMGIYGRFINHQRLINTFVTNMTGPQQQLSIGGCPVRNIIPLTVTTGNVTVSFAVLSYAGRVTITIIADPDTCPDLSELRDAVEFELRVLTEAAAK